MKAKSTPQATSKFTAQERTMLVTLPWIAGAAVSECDVVGGTRAAARESEVLRNAISRCVTVYQIRTGENLTTEPSAFDFEKADSLVDQACKDALALLEKKDTKENVDAYKTFVLDVAHSVAAAYGAGFLGTGQKVSAAETQMIDKIAQALKATHLVDAVKKSAEAAKGK